MLQLRRLTLGQLSTNCYVIYDPQNKEAIIVDPADDADYVTRVLFDLRLTPTKIVATHGHFDHVLAVMELKLDYNIPFCMNKKDDFLVKKIGSLSKYDSSYKDQLVPTTDENLDIRCSMGNNWNITVIPTPGHTPGSMTLYYKKGKFALVGDTIFAKGGLGRVDFSYSDPSKLKASVYKLMLLPDDTVIYPGHGSSFILGDEKDILENALSYL